MKEILIILLNLVFLLIVWVILNYKIKKNSIPSRLEEYTREVERLIVELNRAVDDVVSVSEDRIRQLKSVIKKAEKLLKKIGEKGSGVLLGISEDGKKQNLLDGGSEYAASTGNRKGNNGSNSTGEKGRGNGYYKRFTDSENGKDKQGKIEHSGAREVKENTGSKSNVGESNGKLVQDEGKSLAEKTAHLFAMGYTREEVAKILGVTIGEVEFLRSLGIQKGIRKK